MSGINTDHLTLDIITPTLNHLGEKYASAAAKKLMLGTALVESNLVFLHQIGGGPARGLWQMEPATHGNHVAWLAKAENWGLQQRIGLLLNSSYYLFIPTFSQLAGNLYYACAMARVHYWRVPSQLPDADDLYGLATYWKQHYNTVEGKGTVTRFMQVWHDAGL